MNRNTSEDLVSATVQDVPELLSGRLNGWHQVMLPTGHPYFPRKPILNPSRDLANQKLLFAWGLVPVQCLGSDFKTIEIKYDDIIESVPICDIMVSRYRGRVLEDLECFGSVK